MSMTLPPTVPEGHIVFVDRGRLANGEPALTIFDPNTEHRFRFEEIDLTDCVLVQNDDGAPGHPGVTAWIERR